MHHGSLLLKYSFSQRTINVWNKLSTDCVHASSVNMFKNKLDKYLVKAGYGRVHTCSGRELDSSVPGARVRFASTR